MLQQVIDNAWITLLVVLLPYLIGAAIYGFKLLEHRLPVQAQALIEKACEIAVHASEQYGITHKLTNPQKKAAALDSATVILAHFGIKVPNAVLDPVVEYFVSLLPHQIVDESDTPAFLQDQPTVTVPAVSSGASSLVIAPAPVSVASAV